MRRSRSISVAAGLVLALAACDSLTVVGPTYVQPSYDVQLLSGVGHGGLRTEVVGNPFGVPQNELERAVTGAMKGANFGPPLNFVPPDQAAEGSPYKVVVLFSPAPNAKPEQLCRDGQQDQLQQPGRTRVMTAFCSSGDRVSSTVGQVAQIDSPADPAFRTLMQRVTLPLFPPGQLDNGDNSFNSGNR